MAVIFNATTTQGMQVTPDNSGQIQFQLNGVNVPSPTVAPAFSAYNSAASQTLTNNTATKLVFNTKYFDTNNNFDNATNYRFTPTVAGYYLITGNFSQYLPGSPSFLSYFYIYKNGSSYRFITTAGTGGNAVTNVISEVVYLNGSTDYIELYANLNVYSGSSGANGASGGALATAFSGCLMRAA